MKLTKILGIIFVVALLTGIASADGWKDNTKNKNVFEFQGVLTQKFITTAQDYPYTLLLVAQDNSAAYCILENEEQFNAAVVGETYNYKLTNWQSNQKVNVELTPL